MDKNKKFAAFLESLMTKENTHLIEAIFRGFTTITEANRIEQYNDAQAAKNGQAPETDFDRSSRRQSAQVQRQTAPAKGSNVDLLGKSREKNIRNANSAGANNSENAGLLSQVAKRRAEDVKTAIGKEAPGRSMPNPQKFDEQGKFKR